MKITVNEHERGFQFKNGAFQKLLKPGTYHVFGQTTIRKTTLDKPLHEVFGNAMLAVFRKDAGFRAEVTEADIPDDSVAAHMVGGHFREVLDPGHYVYWAAGEDHEFQVFSTLEPEAKDVPPQLVQRFYKAGKMFAFTVEDFHQGFLTCNGELRYVMMPGHYYFWKTPGLMLNFTCFETRLQELELNGQEILTKDRVGIRLNFICQFRYTDARKAFETSEDCDELFRTQVQLGLREYIAGLTLDELLNSRDTIGDDLLACIKPKAEPLYIEVLSAGVRNVILPGDVREIMNTVLIAEKKAQANVIARREEVASTRSLLNTAKLMDENQTLYKLKELEYLERICENVGNLSVSGGDMLAQLRDIVTSK